MTRATPRKTVYVLGAGFSREAKFPLQADILPCILDFDVEKVGIMGAPKYALEAFQNARSDIKQFLAQMFGSSIRPSLEDVYTLLDQTIARREYCGGYSWMELEKFRDALNRAILFILYHFSKNVSGEAAHFYRSVAAYLIDTRTSVGQDTNLVSLISINWDCLLEDQLYWCIQEANGLRKVDINYCCDTTPLSKNSPHTPSLEQKARGIFDLKIMKIHGSANWLLCPNCNRLHTGAGSPEDVWELYRVVGPATKPEMQQPCPTCGRLHSRSGAISVAQVPYLEPFIVTPTFVKIFDNPHIRMTWHKAYVDLAEAQQVVFIGYSLPECGLPRSDAPAKSYQARSKNCRRPKPFGPGKAQHAKEIQALPCRYTVRNVFRAKFSGFRLRRG